MKKPAKKITAKKGGGRKAPPAPAKKAAPPKRQPLTRAVADQLAKNPPKPSPKAPPDEGPIINQIVARATKLGVVMKKDATQLALDLRTIQTKGKRLDLGALLKYQDDDFAHDVRGIRTHLDRFSGALMHFFVPRCLAMPDFLKRG